MSDLHKPLKPAQTSARPKAWLKPALLLVGISIAGLAAYQFWKQQQSQKTVVAINDPKPAATPSRPEGSTNPSPTNDNSASDPQANSRIADAESQTGLDLSKVKPLSPLLPLDGEEAAKKPPQPTFKPKPQPRSQTSQWVPRPDLIEQSEYGPLPRISDGGMRPLDAYSQSNGTVGANRIAVIVGGLGLSQTGTQQAIRLLPSEITLGFSPFGNSLQRWVQVARREGHEVVLQLPMEPLGYPTIDPGPRTLNSQVETGENLKNLRWSLARMTNYPLVMNYLGAGVSNKSKVMRPILQEVRQRGLGYIDDGTVQVSQALNIARDLSLPHAKGSMLIDTSRNPDSIRAKLKNLESIAKQRGFVIGTASAFPQTVKVIAEWAEEAKRRDILLVPVSNLLTDYSR